MSGGRNEERLKTGDGEGEEDTEQTFHLLSPAAPTPRPLKLVMAAQTSSGTSMSHSQPISVACGGLNVSRQNVKLQTADKPIFNCHEMLADFWPRQKKQIQEIDAATLRDANRHQELPLARIKKIMKLDDDVKSQMISAEAPVLFAKAAEIFIEELTLRAWDHTDENKRRTLQKSDISMAIARCEQFDFLIDIVPRDESLHKAAKMAQQHHTLQQHHTPARMMIETADQTQSPGSGAIMFDQSLLTTPITGDGGIQYFIQMPMTSSSMQSGQEPVQQIAQQTTMGSPLIQLQNGQMVQATQIGQPIQFQTTPGQSVQLVTVGSDGQPIQLQLQLPQTHLSQNNDENES